MSGKEVVPLKPEDVEAAAGDILKPEERIAGILIALSQVMAEDEVPVLFAGKFVFAPNVDGGIDASERTGAKMDTPAFWGIRKGTDVLPLVPEFDPAAVDKDPAVETRFLEFLQALGTVPGAPGQPVIVVKKTLYRLVEGALDMSEAPAEIAEALGPGWLAEGKFLPLTTDFDLRTVTAKAGAEQTLTEEQVALVLATLAGSDERSDFVYISGGRMFRLGNDGKLAAKSDAAAEPVTWPLAHNVRPAQQSLGWKGCTDCHSGGSDFFFTKLRGTGPLLTAHVEKRSAASFMGLGGSLPEVLRAVLHHPATIQSRPGRLRLRHRGARLPGRPAPPRPPGRLPREKGRTMMFTIIVFLSVIGVAAGLTFHRFWTTREEARATILYAELFKKYTAWLALRTIQSTRKASPKAWWEYIKALPLWRLPILEKWLYIGFYGSFVYLAASGFFFAIFFPRGLYGFPLVGHVMAGGLFAACLALVVVFKARNFISVPKPVNLSLALLDPRKMGITAARVKLAAFWLFALTGFLLALTALLPMMPLLRTSGQKFMFEFHRYSALVSLLAAAVYIDLELFGSGRLNNSRNLLQWTFVSFARRIGIGRR